MEDDGLQARAEGEEQQSSRPAPKFLVPRHLTREAITGTKCGRQAAKPWGPGRTSRTDWPGQGVATAGKHKPIAWNSLDMSGGADECAECWVIMAKHKHRDKGVNLAAHADAAEECGYRQHAHRAEVVRHPLSLAHLSLSQPPSRIIEVAGIHRSELPGCNDG
ncbi:uncharacterized protein B0I36DRAFT_323810 [Microdochium trichocladiopsis]|uniref:Uncharacterized protein n=1 Tax=Microdochium trichocladiopsis TaxID=1682393 RepID=A0A9P9BNL8_9PEZI|nr:uncharacterized protein B0I36DRAFT_323810 [Microdochium trichocladiopsis]KAH7031381.1 hypothetical protein B0I36DRAFT_323810 [Microdochium trichocladiopsis]